MEIDFKDYEKQVKLKRDSIDALKVHIPKISVETRHKVVLFGRIFHGTHQDEDDLYQFTHKKADGVITEGYIPVGFLSSLLVNTTMLYFAVRKGELGPEYQVSMRTVEEVVADWDLNPDTMWSSVLSYFDKKCLFADVQMDYLDADPFVLFGLDDPVTQRALRKLEKQPILLSRGKRPDIQEWADYLAPGGDDHHHHHHHHHHEHHGQKLKEQDKKRKKDRKWIIQAFAETELPTPWTSYKGVGSIVCFYNHETRICSWMHPFYPYFAQLWTFCSTADVIDVMQIRVNRLMWSYETVQLTNKVQIPLVSPEYVEELSDIMGFDVAREPYLVRSIKAALKRFSIQYRMQDSIGKDEILELVERMRQECVRNDFTMKSWHETLSNKPFNLDELTHGDVICIECSLTAQSFCLECKDYYCLLCFNKLHNKGSRREHVPFRLIPCAYCAVKPAKVHCTYTDKSLCHECYAMKHVMTLPKDAKESVPVKINYTQEQRNMVKEQEAKLNKLPLPDRPKSGDSRLSRDSYASVLTIDWHPFFDSKGIKFYCNLRTGERMRRSPTATPQPSTVASEVGITDAAALQEVNQKDEEGPRYIRPPFRTHPQAQPEKDQPYAQDDSGLFDQAQSTIPDGALRPRGKYKTNLS